MAAYKSSTNRLRQKGEMAPNIYSLQLHYRSGIISVIIKERLPLRSQPFNYCFLFFLVISGIARLLYIKKQLKFQCHIAIIAYLPSSKFCRQAVWSCLCWAVSLVSPGMVKCWLRHDISAICGLWSHPSGRLAWTDLLVSGQEKSVQDFWSLGTKLIQEHFCSVLHIHWNKLYY